MDPKSRYPRYPKVTLPQAIGIGLALGAAGALGMNLTNKIEQFFTHRPNSYVPGDTTSYHFGISQQTRANHPDLVNQIHHMGMGIICGPIRALMSYYGIIGPIASYFFTAIRLTADQLVEQPANASTWPWTWPINEQVIDLGHKAVYGFFVGWACDKLVRGVDWFN